MTEIRRDVSLSVVIRIDRTGHWVEWSAGHRSTPELLTEAETLASVPAVAEVRFDRITRTTERLSLHDLAAEDEQPAAAPSASADRAAVLREAIARLDALEAEAWDGAESEEHIGRATGVGTAKAELRRMADEAPQP